MSKREKQINDGLGLIKKAIDDNKIDINSNDVESLVIVVLMENGITDETLITALIGTFNFILSIIPDYKAMNFTKKQDVIQYLKKFQNTKGIENGCFLLLLSMIKKESNPLIKPPVNPSQQQAVQQAAQQAAQQQAAQQAAQQQAQPIKLSKQLLVSEGDLADQQLKSAKGSAKKRLGLFDDLTKGKKVAMSKKTLADCIIEFKLPIIYRYWSLDEDDSGMYSGVLLWTVVDEKSFGDNKERYGILWADGQYTEELIDLLWFPKEEIYSFHIPTKLLKKLIPEWTVVKISMLANIKKLSELRGKHVGKLLSDDDIIKYGAAEFLIMLTDADDSGDSGDDFGDDFEEDVFDYVELVEDASKMKLEHIRGDGRCEYRSMASGLNYICVGNGRGEGQINWGVVNHEANPPSEEDALSELVMLTSALAMRVNADDSPSGVPIRDLITPVLIDNFDEHVLNRIGNKKLSDQQKEKIRQGKERYTNLDHYTSVIINTPDSRNLDVLYYGGYNEMSVFFMYVMQNMLSFTLWALRSIMDGRNIPTGSADGILQGQINIINISPISAHYEALYNTNRDQQRNGFNWTRARLVAHLIGYIIRNYNHNNQGEVNVLRKKIHSALLKFETNERGDIIQTLYDTDVDIDGFLGEDIVIALMAEMHQIVEPEMRIEEKSEERGTVKRLKKE